jgi:ABC-type cobalamin/Fe3+-siderophores transport system ATPase subunit
MIERLYVHNFRCLENFTLELAGDSSALLIGKNGAGKSTLLACLRVLQSICRGAGRVGDLIKAQDFTRHRTATPMRFELDVRLGRKRYDYRLSLEWPDSFREARIADEHLAVEGNVVFSRDKAQIQLASGATFGLDWHVFALPIINEKPGDRTIGELKSFLASMFLISPVPERITGYSEGQSNELQGDAANFADCLRALLTHKPAAYSAFDSAVKEVIRDFSSIENVERGATGANLLVHFETQDGRQLSVDFTALSDGEKCFFLGAYVIAAYGAGLARFCMWDEPDSHLSLSEVGQFITALRKTSGRTGQFIATSHHPETVRGFSDETTFVLTRASHLDPTVVRRLSDITYKGDLIDALLRDEVVG